MFLYRGKPQASYPSNPSSSHKMTERILETPLKGQILGAVEYAEHLRETKGIPYTQKEIAEVFGCGPNYVSRIKKLRDDELRVTADPDTRGRKRRHGPTQKELADQFNCSTSTVRKVINHKHPYDDICKSGGQCREVKKPRCVVGRNPDYKPNGVGVK